MSFVFYWLGNLGAAGGQSGSRRGARDEPEAQGLTLILAPEELIMSRMVLPPVPMMAPTAVLGMYRYLEEGEGKGQVRGGERGGQGREESTYTVSLVWSWW